MKTIEPGPFAAHRCPVRYRCLARALTACALALGAWLLPAAAWAQACARTITADVVALDQPFFWNRLGASQPQGMIYALRRDVIPITGTVPGPGNAQLRPDKRPRPLVLPMNVGDCLAVTFTNWLAPVPVDDEQPATRTASMQVTGLPLVGSIASLGSHVGANASSLVAPGGSATYTWYGQREGGYLITSGGAIVGGEGDGGSIPAGLFGAVNVEPAGAEWSPPGRSGTGAR